VHVLNSIPHSCVMPLVPRDLWSGSIHDAVALWSSNQTSAEESYGPISAWSTALVTSLERLFCGYGNSNCGTAQTLGIIVYVSISIYYTFLVFDA
jgi:hypothetical protein